MNTMRKPRPVRENKQFFRVWAPYYFIEGDTPRTPIHPLSTRAADETTELIKRVMDKDKSK